MPVSLPGLLMSGTINFGTGQTYFVFSGMTKIRLTENQVGKQINRETKERKYVLLKRMT